MCLEVEMCGPDAKTDRAGRIFVQPELAIPCHADIFVIGDLAHVEQNGKPLPAVAQVAMQQAAAKELETAQRIPLSMSHIGLYVHDLPAINASLKKNKQEAITPLAEADWQKKRDAESGPASGAGRWAASA